MRSHTSCLRTVHGMLLPPAMQCARSEVMTHVVCHEAAQARGADSMSSCMLCMLLCVAHGIVVSRCTLGAAANADGGGVRPAPLCGQPEPHGGCPRLWWLRVCQPDCGQAVRVARAAGADSLPWPCMLQGWPQAVTTPSWSHASQAAHLAYGTLLTRACLQADDPLWQSGMCFNACRCSGQQAHGRMPGVAAGSSWLLWLT